MKEIIKLLDQSKNVDGYRITQKATKSYELFFVHKKVETVRSTDTVSCDVTVYVDHDGKIGDSSFSVYGSMTRGDIEKKIAAAVERAKLVFNEPYELPDKDTLYAELPTNMKDCDMKDVAAKTADAVFAADDIDGGSINALEIFVYRDTVHVINSRGVDKTQVIHRVMIEAIPTFTDDNESVELYEDYRFTEFDEKKITAEIRSKMEEVKARSEAKKPQTPLDINVILRPHEISTIMENLAYDVNYASVYMHANLHNVGDDIQKDGDGDKLTLTLKGIVEGSEESAYFDADGTDLTDTKIIDGGVIASLSGASRFGQYLGVKKPSGQLNCFELMPGTLTDKEIKSAPYIECVSMSGLQLELYSDYIGGEIRLAYYFDGEKTVPVTGITMSAKLSDVLKSIKLSDTVTVSGEYRGPEKILLKDVHIL